MMTFAKILLGVDNKRNKQKEKKEKEKKASDKYQDRIKKTQCTNNIISQQKKKDKVKRKKKMMILKEKIEKTAKGNCRFRREEKLGPQASSRVTPCPPAPNHTRGEVIRPPSQIKNNSYSMI